MDPAKSNALCGVLLNFLHLTCYTGLTVPHSIKGLLQTLL